MCLETLKDLKKIDGFDVVDMEELKKDYPHIFKDDGSMDYSIFERDIRPNKYIYIRHDVNSLSFTLQNGAIKEKGVNGCQVDTIIEAARLILIGLNKNFPSRETSLAITKIEEALLWLLKRKIDREKRGVEGFSKKLIGGFMEEKLGVQNLKLLIAFPIELGNIGDAIGKENSKNWKKWLKLIELFDEVVDLLKVDWKKIKDEYKDLDEVEKVELKEFIKEKFNIENDKLENAIEESLEIILSLETAIKRSISIFKNING